MIKNKEQYCSPTTNILVVRVEGVLMTSDVYDPNAVRSNSSSSGYIVYDLDEI